MATKGKLKVNMEEFHIEWRIDNFLSLPHAGDFYISPTFSFADSYWCLNVYPNGNAEYNSEGFVSVYLYRKSAGPQMDLDCRFSLKTLNPEDDGEKQFAHAFIRRKKGYGIPFFLSRSELKKRKAELLPSDIFTILCSLRFPKSDEDANGTATAKCSYCKENVDVKGRTAHEKKCLNKPIKCPECSEVVAVKDWYKHECQTAKAQGGTGITKCSYWNEELSSKNISSHEKTFSTKTIKCSECSKVVLFQKCYDQEYQTTGNEDTGSLTQDYKKVLLHGTNHDLIMKIGDKELKAHRDILRARSRVFESMLSHDMTEKNSGVIDVPDCDPQAMEQFLSYLYCGKVETLDESNMLELYYIADKYDMRCLKEDCSNFMKNSLSTTNICEVLQLALNHNDNNLLDTASSYFMDNVLDIMRTVEWQSFLKDNSVVGNDLLIKSFEKVKNVNG